MNNERLHARAAYGCARSGAAGKYEWGNECRRATFTPEETVRSVGRMLERLPYYGVFDYIVFRVDRGTVYLAGYSFEGR